MTTGFDVELTGLEVENPKRIRSASACEPFREAIELGLSRGRDATAIWQDLVDPARRSASCWSGCGSGPRNTVTRPAWASTALVDGDIPSAGQPGSGPGSGGGTLGW